MNWRWFILVVLALGGCARFEPRPLSPVQSAAELEGRSLTNGALKVFLSENLHRDWTNWPAARWDFEMLTFAAFYYQPSLAVARADWHLAQGGTRTAAGRPNPTISTGTGYDSGIANSVSPWMPWVTFDLPVETAGKRQRRIEQADYLSESAQLHLATAAWQVRSELRSNLVEFIAADQRADLLQEQLRLRQEMAGRLERQREAGAIAATDLTAARVELARTTRNFADARLQLTGSRARLAEAIGIPASGLGDTVFDFDLLQAPAAEHLISAEARSTALHSRTDILGALADYAASQSALQLEIAKQFPDVHLNPGYLWNQGNEGDNEWQLGLTLEVPVINQNQGPIAEAKARRDVSAAQFIALQASVIGEIDQVVAVYDASRKNLAEVKSFMATEKAQFEDTEARFKAGAADQLDLLGARLEFATAALDQLEARVRLQQAVGALEDAMQRPVSGAMNVAAALKDNDSLSRAYPAPQQTRSPSQPETKK